MSVSEYQCDHYFKDLDGSNKIYALIEPKPLPVFGNKKGRDVIHNTLPGFGLSGSVESGRPIHYTLGCGYEDIIELNFDLADDEGDNIDFVTEMNSKRDSMNDFIYSPDDGITEYRVAFTGEKPLEFYKDASDVGERPSRGCRMNLIVLEEV